MQIKRYSCGSAMTRWGSVLALTLAVLITIPESRAQQPIADPDVSAHVEREILFDPAVPHDLIDVATANGVVTLTGTVDNLLAKERATHIAQTVRGVRSVVNRIKVDPDVYRPVNDLQKGVKDALLFDPATDAYELTVKTNDKGIVTLGGTVESWAERDLAETVAKSVRGVAGVNNNILVTFPVERPDTEIKSEVVRKLHWDTLVDDALINVRVAGQTVILSGTVGSAAEKDRAEWNAWVNGVKTVESSDLKVERWARDDDLRKGKYVKRSDPEIRNAVQEALRRDPRVKEFKLDVAVNEGYVTLQGVVDNLEAKNAAVRDARNTVGVTMVESLIKVRPVAKLTDAEVAKNVRDALARNVYTESYEIGVNVRNQIVRLEGAVDSYFEKAEAENVAFRTLGVKQVRNNLDVQFPHLIVDDPYVYSWSIYDYPWFDRDTVILKQKSDWQITEDIRDELFWSPFVDSDEVTVSVLDGVAILSGTLDSWGEYRAAQENAFEGGAITVINKLDVKPD